MTADRGELHVVLGATGHIGSAVTSALLRAGRSARVVTRYPDSAASWRRRGADAAVADVADPVALERALSHDGPVRVFALNPPGRVDGDPDAAEIRSADAIADALERARPERVVAVSTWGARPGRGIGDLGTLHHFEQRLSALPAPVAVLRAGYLFSNWSGAVEQARAEGLLPVMLSPDRALPMVDPADVGEEAARLLRRSTAATGVRHVEGPERLSPQDVADVLAAVLGRSVRVSRTGPQGWRAAFLGAGFSPAAADSFVGLNRLVDQEDWAADGALVRGGTRLRTYLSGLVDRPRPDGAS